MSVTSSSKEGRGRALALRDSWSCCVAVEMRLESSRMREGEAIFGLKRSQANLGERFVRLQAEFSLRKMT